MKDRLGIEQQREKFISVIDYLKSKGIKQTDIGAKIGADNIYISHLRSGIIKNITQAVINKLHDGYNINPQYITHGASNMFDTAGLKYENFDSFVDNWDLVEHEDREYLHFAMDENFYKFLVNVFNLKEASSKTDDVAKAAEAFDKALDSLKENYQPSKTSKEYVLIPADKIPEIAQDNILKRKRLTEVMNMLSLYPPKN